MPPSPEADEFLTITEAENTPLLIVDPVNGPPGTHHTIQISGFAANAPVTIQITAVDTAANLLTATIQTDANGGASFVATSLATDRPTLYSVVAQDNAGNSAQGFFSIDG